MNQTDPAAQSDRLLPDAVRRHAGASLFNVRGGSFKSDPLPQGADLVSLVRLVHDHDARQHLGQRPGLHGLTHTMEHEPRGFLRHAKATRNLDFNRLIAQGLIERLGKGKNTYYKLKQ